MDPSDFTKLYSYVSITSLGILIGIKL